MAFPADPPSLSWHLGCEMSDLPLPWNPLPPHCTIEQSGSPGSMESLGPAGQSYYEGGLSPADQAMDRGKRDSAYSSFSASSSTSDSALRPEETGSLDGAQPSQLPEPRYLQTGGEATDLPSAASGARFAASVPSGSLPSSAKAAAAPPQPPVRQDSLRVCGSPPHADSLCPEDRWRSDTTLCMAGRDAHGPGGQLATTGPPKDAPLPYQYYLLSSQTEPPPGMKKGPPGPHCSLAESPGHPPGGPPEGKEQQAGPDSLPKSPASWEGGWAGPFGHRHSVPENLLVAQLRALDASRGQGEPRWTVSPLHREPEGLGAQDPWLLPDCGGQAEELDSPPAAREGPPSARGTCVALGRPQSTLGAQTGSPLLPAFDRASSPLPGFQAAPALGHLPDPEGSPPAAQKGQHRPAHIRRRSERFATNLRNEIQWRRAQLQKAHGPGGLGCGEEPPTPEPENPPAKAAALAPPAPLGDGKPRGSSGLPAVAPKRWGSELSVFGEGRATCSPQSPPAPAGGWGGGRWRWSPEHKLQPQQLEPRPCPPPPLEEPGLLPFADRRKFFEETSRPATARPCGPPQGRLGPDAERPGSPEHGDLRHPSLDRPCRGPALLPLYQEFPPELLGVGKAPAWPGTEAERWWPLPCSCALREACACSGFRDECTMLHARSMPVPTCHCAHHCHPCSWSCCSERCCPTQQKLREDGGPWQARKPFQVERPPDEWEPPAVSRASIQALSQLLQHTGPFARASPCQTCFEHTELAWPPACRAASTHGLPWYCEQPRRVLGKGGPGGGPGEPHKPPLRERAYSESHLCTGPAGVSVREGREAPSEEAGPTSPPYQARRRAPPPPRPPPPNWEKCRPAWALHQQPLPAPPGPPARGEGSRVPGQPASEAARQRSRSLPAEQLSHNRPPLQARLPPCAGSGGASSLSEQDGPHRYHHESPAWSLELLSAQSAPSRVASPLEGAAAEEQETSSGSPSEQLPARRHQQGVPLSQDATGGSRKSGPPPSRLNSEELMRDVAGKDHSLAGVLGSGLGLRSAAEVMSDLFAASRCPLRPGQDWSPLVSGVRGPERQRESPEAATARGAPGAPPGLTYLNLSAGKAELLDKTKGQPEPPAAASEEELDHDLAQKKVQLIESLSQKLAVLQEAQQSLQDDLRANGALGREVEGHIKGACKPHELEKFRLVVGDLDKVVNLLLSLSGRLARVENALGGLNAEEEEKMALLEKKRQLIAQLEDAKELQEHVAQREQLVFASVSHCLPPEQLEDYQHFLRMKSTLAIQQRQLDDKIKLGKEQLHCLWESLPRRPREH